MPDDKNTSPAITMDGFSKVRPLHEGYLAKGGSNNTSQITVRPPAPTILTPKAQPAATPAPAAIDDKPKP